MRRFPLPLFLLIFLFNCCEIKAQQYFGQIPEIRNIKIIAVGESAHGVKEFYGCKSAFFKALVAQGITKTLMIGTNYSAASVLNEYIHNRNAANVDSVMKAGLYGIWRSPEMAELIDWMRVYNHTKPEGEKLSFVGFDGQSSAIAIDYIVSFLKEEVPGFDKSIPEDGLELVKEMGTAHYNFRRLPKEARQDLINTVEKLRILIDKLADGSDSVHFHMKVVEHNLRFEMLIPSILQISGTRTWQKWLKRF